MQKDARIIQAERILMQKDTTQRQPKLVLIQKGLLLLQVELLLMQKGLLLLQVDSILMQKEPLQMQSDLAPMQRDKPPKLMEPYHIAEVIIPLQMVVHRLHMAIFQKLHSLHSLLLAMEMTRRKTQFLR